MTSYIAEIPKTASNFLSRLFGMTVDVGSKIYTPEGDGIITDVIYNPPMNFAMPTTVKSVRVVVNNEVIYYSGHRLRKINKTTYGITENLV